jgi:hypothetical protein
MVDGSQFIDHDLGGELPRDKPAFLTGQPQK